LDQNAQNLNRGVLWVSSSVRFISFIPGCGPSQQGRTYCDEAWIRNEGAYQLHLQSILLESPHKQVLQLITGWSTLFVTLVTRFNVNFY